jgi:hypothetical protein
MQIEWTDEDPGTGRKRFVRAEKFARRWTFRVRFRRRTDWEPAPAVSREMLETLLDALERRYVRREGVTDEDLQQVRAALAGWKPPPAVEGISPQRHEDRTKGHKEEEGENRE